MEKYLIRFAVTEDKENIKHFFKSNWRRLQTIEIDKYFDFYYKNNNTDLNFVLAIDSDNNIIGIMGFISPNKKYERELWGSNWKVLKSEDPMLAIRMIYFLTESNNINLLGVNNLESTSLLWSYIGKIKEMTHYYRLNDRENYKIAIVRKKKILDVQIGKYKLKKINEFSDLEKRFMPPENRRPYKDIWYIKRRYFEFPYFDYNVYLLDGGTFYCNSIIVTRDAVWKEEKVLRIVDFIGLDYEFSEIGSELQLLLCTGKYEFLDMWCWGIEEEIIKKAGLLSVKEDSYNIIPDKYEPLIQKNEIILCSSTDSLNNFYAFRADADNDRPNLQETV